MRDRDIPKVFTKLIKKGAGKKSFLSFKKWRDHLETTSKVVRLTFIAPFSLNYGPRKKTCKRLNLKTLIELLKCQYSYANIIAFCGRVCFSVAFFTILLTWVSQVCLAMVCHSLAVAWFGCGTAFKSPRHFKIYL